MKYTWQTLLHYLRHGSQHLVTIRKSLWLPFWLSGYKTRQIPDKCHITCEGSFTLFIRKMQSRWELIITKMSCQSFISTGYHTSTHQFYLATAEFPRTKLKSEIVYNIYFTLKFRIFLSTQNISAIVSLCFEVSPGPFGYCVAHDSWQEIHHISSKWNKMCQPQKKQKQHSNNTMISQN